MEDKNYYQRKGYVSNSALNCLLKSPATFKKYIDGLLEEESKDYFRFGQLVHLRILEPKEFDDTVLVYDYTVPKSPQQKSFVEDVYNVYDEDTLSDILTQSYKQNYATKESDDKILDKATVLYATLKSYATFLRIKDVKTIISTKEFEKIKDMELSCRNHKVAKHLLFDLPHPLAKENEDSYNEFEILWEYNGVKCKSLVDRVVVDHTNKIIKLIDFKTTAKLHSFNESYKNFGYDRQLAFYTKALAHKLNLEDYTFEHYIVACDTITHETKVFKIDSIQDATEEIEKLLDRAKWHIDNNQYEHSMEYYTKDGYETL